METKAFIEYLQQSNMVREIAKEFGISEDVAIRRILIALSNADFTNQILDPLKNYLNKIDSLEDSKGRITIINLDQFEREE